MHESEKWKWSCSVVSDSSQPHGLQLPGSSIHGIFQARVLEWGASAFSKLWTYTSYNDKFYQKEESRVKQGTEVVFYVLWFERSLLVKWRLEGDLNAVRNNQCIRSYTCYLKWSSVKLNCKLIRWPINKDDILEIVDVILSFSLWLLYNDRIYSQT